ncbi:MAG: bifunctional diguanylate cyclase/phosphodiesterase [Nitriliruptor sp.]|nr:MAG: bifunctional diguanylate cyclase/phosphodiesterase [Nitriliruptor sp.]
MHRGRAGPGRGLRAHPGLTSPTSLRFTLLVPILRARATSGRTSHGRARSRRGVPCARQQDDLDELLGLLELIPGILRDFADLAPDDLDAGIGDALRRIGEFAAVDRSYMFLFDADLVLMDNTHEWCASGIEPQIDDLQRVPADLISWWLPQFDLGNVVDVPSVADLPDERSGERDLLAPQDIASQVTVPLLTAGRLVGFIGFDSVRSQRAWSDGAIRLLRTVANAISSALLLDRLQQALERTRRSDRSVGVVFLDLDRFKLINDSLGHNKGDELLIEVAHRLTEQVRSCDTVARFGGDEFVILLDDVDESSEALRGSDRLLEVFQRPFRIGQRDHVMTASAGVVVGADRCDPEAILRDADAAMYQAKESGRARIQRFDAPLRDALLLRVELAQDLHGSIERGELTLDYQPLFHLCDDTMLGVEALLRWHHPRRGWITPSEFIPIAEEHGLIVPMGRFVLDETLRQLRAWDEQYPWLEGLTASVNLSVHQLTEDDLPGTVSELLALHGIYPQRLCLELTESALMEEPEAGRAVLGQLRELGVRLAIDDFGTGYSSLAYLRELPVTSLKIDQSFMTGLGSDDRDARVITAIIGLAHEFDLAVVGEGIETAAQLRELRQLGCDVGQGYFLQRPVPPSVIPHLDRMQGYEAS